MRFFCVAKADESTEAAPPSDPELFAKMEKFVEEQFKAGVLLATAGLHPSSKGARVKVANGKATVVDGPFAETKEVIASYAIIEAASKEEAIHQVTRFLNLAGGGEADIYQVFDESDAPAA